MATNNIDYRHWGDYLPQDQADWVQRYRTTSVSGIHTIAVTLTRQSVDQPWGFIMKGGAEHRSLFVISKVGTLTITHTCFVYPHIYAYI